MQKIMFNSKLGLEQAVLDGRKTMTRRIIHDDVVKRYSDPWDLIGNCSRYHFDKVSGKGTWDSNPWVFVYEFKLID